MAFAISAHTGANGFGSPGLSTHEDIFQRLPPSAVLPGPPPVGGCHTSGSPTGVQFFAATWQRPGSVLLGSHCAYAHRNFVSAAQPAGRTDATHLATHASVVPPVQPLHVLLPETALAR